MYRLKLTNTKTNVTAYVVANKTVEKWLWNNFYNLGYDEIENLTNMESA